MKRKSKLLMLVVTVAILVAFSAGSAFATTYDNCAAALNQMGLFKGGSTGFELDRPATRAEATVMLVRLLGAEGQALAGAYSHPFTDVPGWASPYVGYMYKNGLAKGVSATSFQPQGPCDLNTYCTFVLRALGYEDTAGDFSYSTAGKKAAELGVVDEFTGAGNFLRDQMVAVSYTALATQPKGKTGTLLDQLVAQGAVNAAAAKPYQELFANYARLNEATEAYNAQDQYHVALDAQIESGGEQIKMSGTMKMDTSALADLETASTLEVLQKTKYDYDVVMESSDPEVGTVPMKMVLVDGVIYMDMGQYLEQEGEDTDFPGKIKMDFGKILEENPDLLAEVEGQEQQGGSSDQLSIPQPLDPHAANYGVSMLKSIKIEDAENGGSTITVEFIDLGGAVTNKMLALPGAAMPAADNGSMAAMTMPELKGVYMLDKEDRITSMEIVMDMTASTQENGAESAMSMKINMQLQNVDEKLTIEKPQDSESYLDFFGLLEGLSEASSEETATAEKTIDIQVGKDYKANTFDFSIKSIEEVEQYAGYQPAAGNKLYDVVIKQTGSAADGTVLSSVDWKLDSDDLLIPLFPINTIEGRAEMMPEIFELAKGESVTQHIVFEVPAGATSLTLRFLDKDANGGYNQEFVCPLEK